MAGGREGHEPGVRTLEFSCGLGPCSQVGVPEGWAAKQKAGFRDEHLGARIVRELWLLELTRARV